MARVSVTQIENEIKLQIHRQDGRRIHRKTKDFADEVRNKWIEIWFAEGPHPYATGGYVTSIHVKRTRSKFGFSAYEVETKHANANFIEYGTGPDKPGSKSPWGPHTPTPEFAPAAKTAHFFGGTPG